MPAKDPKQGLLTTLSLERSLDIEITKASLTYNLALHALPGSFCVNRVKKAFSIVSLSAVLSHLFIYSLYCDYGQVVV